jgi:hypothetical protein
MSICAAIQHIKTLLALLCCTCNISIVEEWVPSIPRPLLPSPPNSFLATVVPLHNVVFAAWGVGMCNALDPTFENPVDNRMTDVTQVIKELYDASLGSYVSIPSLSSLPFHNLSPCNPFPSHSYLSSGTRCSHRMPWLRTWVVTLH